MTATRTIYVHSHLDVVTARMQTREIARQMGFGTADQARISLATSELARALSWNTSTTGEITVSGTHHGSHHGLQVACLVNLEHNGAEKLEWDNETSVLGRCLVGARKLADESTVEEYAKNQICVKLVKWNHKEDS